MELVYITSACTIVSAIITILNFSKEGKTFSKLLSAVFTIGLLSTVIYLAMMNKKKIEKVTGDFFENKKANSPDKSTAAIFDTIVEVNDSIDGIIQLKFDAAKSITNSTEMCEELEKIVHYSVRQTKFNNAIMVCEKISNSTIQTSNLEFVSLVSLACKNYDASIKAARLIPNSTSKTDILGKIVDFCILHRKHSFAIIAANSIPNTTYQNDCLKKVLQHLN